MKDRFSIRECLRAYTGESLEIMCSEWQLSAHEKDSRIHALEKVLQDPLHVRERMAELDDGAVRMVYFVSEHGETSIADILATSALYHPEKPAAAILQALLRLGFLLICPEKIESPFSLDTAKWSYFNPEMAPVLFVPSIVREFLPDVPRLTCNLAPESSTWAPESSGGNGAKAIEAFLETIRLVELHPPRLTASGKVHRSDVARIEEDAREMGIAADAVQLALQVALRMECLEERKGRLFATKKIQEWVAQPHGKRLRDLFNAYIQCEDMGIVNTFFGRFAPVIEQHLLPGTLRRRYHKLLVTEMLRGLEKGAWYAVSSFIHAIWERDRNIFFLEEKWRAIHAQVRQSSNTWKERSWNMYEHRFFSWLVGKALPAFGIIELADNGRLFRISPLGCFILDGTGTPPEENIEGREQAVIVQANFEIIAYLERCETAFRRKLDLFTQRVQGNRVCTCRISQDSVYRGIQAGCSIQEFITELNSHCRTGIPRNVAEQLETWRKKFESIILRTDCHVIECRNSAEAQRILREHPGTRPLGKRCVLCLNGIPEHGICINYHEMLEPVVEQDEGLRLRVPWEKTSLLLTRQLQELGQIKRKRSGDIIVELTPHVREKNGKKKTASASRCLVQDVGMRLAMLEALVAEPLAARYRAALRSWAGETSKGYSRHATLVRFDDPEVCQAALESSAARRCVEGRLGAHTLVLRSGKLAEFKKHLKEQGIPIVPGNEPWDDGPVEPDATVQVEQQEEGEEKKTSTGKKTRKEKMYSKTPASTRALLPSYTPPITCEILEDAIHRHKPVMIAYQSSWSERPSIRKVNPISLDTLGEMPSFCGYCHTRERARVFKIAKIRGIRILENESF